MAYYLIVVSTRAVHLVNVTDTRHIIFISLTPYSLRLGLNTTYGTECSNSTIQYTKRTFNLNREVYVSRSVNQVDFITVAQIVPECSRSSGSNRDTTLLLLRHPVHCSSTIMSLTDLVCQTCVKQDTFRSRCLTSVNVSHDTDVPSEHQLLIVVCHILFIALKIKI